MTNIDEIRAVLHANASELLHGTVDEAGDALDRITAQIDGPVTYAAAVGFFAELAAYTLRAERATLPFAARLSPFFLFPSDEQSPRRAAQQIVTARANDDQPMMIALLTPYAEQDPHTEQEAAQLIGALAGLAVRLHAPRCTCTPGPTA